MVRNFVKNQQHENVLEQDIYDGLSEMLPQFGNPLTFFTEIVMPYDDTIQMATVAQKSVEKEAKEVNSRAQNEFTNKRKCIELEREVRAKQTRTSETYGTYGGETYNYNQKFFETWPGEYVLVAPDLSPGKLLHGGLASLKQCTERERIIYSQSGMMNAQLQGNQLRKISHMLELQCSHFFSVHRNRQERGKSQKSLFLTPPTRHQSILQLLKYTLFFQRDMQQIRRGDGEQRLWVC